jgi:hypothetical protein
MIPPILIISPFTISSLATKILLRLEVYNVRNTEIREGKEKNYMLLRWNMSPPRPG